MIEKDGIFCDFCGDPIEKGKTCYKARKGSNADADYICEYCVSMKAEEMFDEAYEKTLAESSELIPQEV